MSIYSSQRNESTVEFLKSSSDLRVLIIRLVKKLPKSYRWIISDNLLKLAADIYTNCLKANSIYIHKSMNPHDFELRHRYEIQALANINALEGEITFLFELLDRGNTVFKEWRDGYKKFKIISEQTIKTKNLIKALIESNKKRFEKYNIQ